MLFMMLCNPMALLRSAWGAWKGVGKEMMSLGKSVSTIKYLSYWCPRMPLVICLSTGEGTSRGVSGSFTSSVGMTSDSFDSDQDESTTSSDYEESSGRNDDSSRRESARSNMTGIGGESITGRSLSSTQSSGEHLRMSSGSMKSVVGLRARVRESVFLWVASTIAAHDETLSACSITHEQAVCGSRRRELVKWKNR